MYLDFPNNLLFIWKVNFVLEVLGLECHHSYNTSGYDLLCLFHEHCRLPKTANRTTLVQTIILL